ncbi:MAG: TlpA family protein disulfide reductase [Bacteroidales bacterium]|nr:TlpA family protein disulfide reductase [Bacteroidales bacterium]
MIRKFFIAFWILCFYLSCTKQDKAIIRIKIDNGNGEKIYLIEQRVTANHISDSCTLRGRGSCNFTVNLKNPVFYYLKFFNAEELSIILSPGEKLELTADYNDFHGTKSISGSENSIRLNELYDSLRSTIVKLEALRNKYDSLNNAAQGDEILRSSIERTYFDIQKAYHKYSVEFILSDLASLVNIAALYQEYSPGEFVFNDQRDLQFFKLVSDSLLKYYPDLRHVKQFKDNYNSMFMDYQKQRLLQSTVAIERDIPELILPDINGEPIALSSFKGKLVLLSFWSVLNKESVANVIEMKKIYKKYAPSGFEIYQVSIDRNVEIWKKALNFEEIEWVSVCDTAFERSATRTIFNVTKIPMNYLISRDQTEILAKNLPPEELDLNLPTLLKH